MANGRDPFIGDFRDSSKCTKSLHHIRAIGKSCNVEFRKQQIVQRIHVAEHDGKLIDLHSRHYSEIKIDYFHNWNAVVCNCRGWKTRDESEEGEF